MCLAIWWPCAGPSSTVRRMSMSSVPCIRFMVGSLPSIRRASLQKVRSIFFGILLQASVLTHHGDNARTGANQNSATAQVWHTGPEVLGSPIDSQSFYAEIGKERCTDLTVEMGITGTPAIDSDGVVYVAAKAKGGAGYEYTLFALDLANGAKLGQLAIGGEVRGKGMGSVNGKIRFDPKLHLNRPALLLAGKTLYAAFGGNC